MFRAMSWATVACSSMAAAIEETMSLTSRITARNLLDFRDTVRGRRRNAINPNFDVFGRAAVCWASPLISLATTAKPFPAEPVRAASIVAVRARRLVWEDLGYGFRDFADLLRRLPQLLDLCCNSVGLGAKNPNPAEPESARARLSPRQP